MNTNSINHRNAIVSQMARVRKLLLVSASVAILGAVASIGAKAAPTGGSVTWSSNSQNQSNTISTVGGTTTINQTSAKIAINWTTFNVLANEAVQYSVPDGGATLNRVLTGTTTISGIVNSNGTLYFVNPNGITINAGARVSANGFVATTRNITLTDFGTPGSTPFTAFGSAYSSVVVPTSSTINLNGTISLTGGNVSVISPTVNIGGTINNSSGNVSIYAATTGVSVPTATIADVDSSGTVTLTSGAVASSNAAIPNTIGSGSAAIFTAQSVNLNSLGKINLSLNLTVLTATELTMKSTSDLTISGSVTASAAMLTLTSGGNITNATGVIYVDTLNIESYKTGVASSTTDFVSINLQGLQVNSLETLTMESVNRRSVLSLTNSKTLTVNSPSTTVFATVTIKTVGINSDLIFNQGDFVINGAGEVNLTAGGGFESKSGSIAVSGNLKITSVGGYTHIDSDIYSSGDVRIESSGLASLASTKEIDAQSNIYITSGTNDPTVIHGTLRAGNSTNQADPYYLQTEANYDSAAGKTITITGNGGVSIIGATIYALSNITINSNNGVMYADSSSSFVSDFGTVKISALTSLIDADTPYAVSVGDIKALSGVLIDSDDGVHITGQICAGQNSSCDGIYTNSTDARATSFAGNATIKINDATTRGGVVIIDGVLTAGSHINITAKDDLTIDHAITTNKLGDVILTSTYGNINTSSSDITAYGKVKLTANTAGFTRNITVGNITAINVASPSTTLQKTIDAAKYIDIQANGLVKVTEAKKLVAIAMPNEPAAYANNISYYLQTANISISAGTRGIQVDGRISTFAADDREDADDGTYTSGNGGNIKLLSSGNITINSSMFTAKRTGFRYNYGKNSLTGTELANVNSQSANIHIETTGNGKITVNSALNAEGAVIVTSANGNITFSGDHAITSAAPNALNGMIRVTTTNGSIVVQDDFDFNSNGTSDGTTNGTFSGNAGDTVIAAAIEVFTNSSTKSNIIIGNGELTAAGKISIRTFNLGNILLAGTTLTATGANSSINLLTGNQVWTQVGTQYAWVFSGTGDITLTDGTITSNAQTNVKVINNGNISMSNQTLIAEGASGRITVSSARNGTINLGSTNLTANAGMTFISSGAFAADSTSTLVLTGGVLEISARGDIVLSSSSNSLREIKSISSNGGIISITNSDALILDNVASTNTFSTGITTKQDITITSSGAVTFLSPSVGLSYVGKSLTITAPLPFTRPSGQSNLYPITFVQGD